MRISDWSSDVCSSDLVALAVLHEGSPPLIRTYGVRDVAAGAPVTPETAFALGSITKTMTALGFAILADEGRIEWDRSEERRVGKECGSTCRSRWSQSH